MKQIQVTEKNNLKGGGKLKNNKGFSLVELLIVVAIMGVLVVLSFNVFGNVLSNSKEKADLQQASNIAKAIQTYCLESDDWALANAAHTDSTALVAALTVPIGTGPTYGPYVALKDASLTAADPGNAAALAPQYSANTGWVIVVDGTSQNVTCAPSATLNTVTIK